MLFVPDAGAVVKCIKPLLILKSVVSTPPILTFILGILVGVKVRSNTFVLALPLNNLDSLDAEVNVILGNGVAKVSTVYAEVTTLLIFTLIWSSSI